MPYDSAGTFSLVPSYKAAPGGTIRTEQHNPPLEDIAAGMSSVLPRDGRAGMVGTLDMGSFPISNVGAGSNSTDAATIGQVQSAMPIGVVLDYAGATVPPGWLLCYGQAISRATYAALFSAIGTTYGAGDGSTTFNVPDCRDVVIVGRGNMGATARGLLSKFSSTVLGSLFGVQEHTLTIDQTPAHQHGAGSLIAASHSHTTTIPTRAGFWSGSGSDSSRLSQANPSGGGSSLDVGSNSSGALTVSGSTSSAGGGGSHPNVQPSLVMNKIIKASY